MDSYLIFYVVAGLLLLAEAFSPGLFIFICFAAATAVTGVVDHMTDLRLEILLAILLVLSVINLFAVRPLLQTIIKIPKEVDPTSLGTYVKDLIGKEAMVFKAIQTHEMGVVKLYDYDETWLAKSEDGRDIGQGTTVVIKAVQGNHLIVSS
jgi:membrane protein implicated in regulation of membrane protease activity